MIMIVIQTIFEHDNMIILKKTRISSAEALAAKRRKTKIWKCGYYKHQQKKNMLICYNALHVSKVVKKKEKNRFFEYASVVKSRQEKIWITQLNLFILFMSFYHKNWVALSSCQHNLIGFHIHISSSAGTSLNHQIDKENDLFK